MLGGARLGEGASDPFLKLVIRAEKPIVWPRVTTTLDWEKRRRSDRIILVASLFARSERPAIIR